MPEGAPKLPLHEDSQEAFDWLVQRAKERRSQDEEDRERLSAAAKDSMPAVMDNVAWIFGAYSTLNDEAKKEADRILNDYAELVVVTAQASANIERLLAKGKTLSMPQNEQETA